MGLGTVQGLGIDHHSSYQEECYHFGCHRVCESFSLGPRWCPSMGMLVRGTKNDAVRDLGAKGELSAGTGTHPCGQWALVLWRVSY